MEKNLGHATAYGYAKSKGYSGTEEEFAQLMADYASVGQSAAQSAEQAAASATSASGSASTASQAAQTATSKASEAVTAADTATTKASEASTSADTASAAATSAGTSAQTATTAAATATTKASEASESATTASTAKTDAETARDAAAQSASEAAAQAASIDPDEFDRKIYAAFATDTATGAVASFPDGADNIPMKDVLVHIEPVQAGSGDPSPDNVRPITGWTGAKVTRTGKNLLNPTLASGTHTGNGITWTLNNDGSVTVSGTATSNSYLWIYGSYSTPIPSWVYKLAGKTVTASTGNGSFNREGYASIQVILYGSPAFVIREVTTTVPSDLSPYTSFAIALYISKGTTVDATVYPQLELGSTATAYEPYSGQAYDITFPTEAGTVYGGTLDVSKGELVVTHRFATFDGSENWGHPNANYFVIWDQSPSVSNNDLTQKSNWLVAGSNDYVDYGKFRVQTNGALAVGNKEDVLTLNEFKAKLAETPLQIYYKLATPITYQLTPQEITSLLGTNNLLADTGDSEVEYRADTKMYITKKITEAVSALS